MEILRFFEWSDLIAVGMVVVFFVKALPDMNMADRAVRRARRRAGMSERSMADVPTFLMRLVIYGIMALCVAYLATKWTGNL